MGEEDNRLQVTTISRRYVLRREGEIEQCGMRIETLEERLLATTVNQIRPFTNMERGEQSKSEKYCG